MQAIRYQIQVLLVTDCLPTGIAIKGPNLDYSPAILSETRIKVGFGT